MIRRTLRALLHVSAAASLVLVSALASAGGAHASAPDALLRGGHFSPDTPGVDVYLTAFSGGTTTLWLSKVGYGDVSGYERVTPGLYAVAMRPHGAAASTPAALTWTLNAGAGKAYTAAAVGRNKQLKGIVLNDDLSQPRQGFASVRVIQAASRAPHVDVVEQSGTRIASGTAFGTQTAYTSVAAGNVALVARSVETPTLQAVANVSIPAGSVETVVVLDAPGSGIVVRTLVDATGTGTSPVGAVPAGGGGTAGLPAAPAVPTDWLAVIAITAGGLLAASGLALGLSTRRGR